ncbi:MAG TPA: SGNH/GDSL hydrolase family protein [Flavipsychrobacter sp.]
MLYHLFSGICILFFSATSLAQTNTTTMHTYLALGDSYTIGEQVPAKENFPHQLVTMLNKDGIATADPEIIAVTGWTTDELAAAIQERNITGTYSFVTLLIGVNNQYRGRTVENYREEYTALLQQAIGFAGGKPERVFVLSIPDWGVTPFAEGRDRSKIAQEIDAYNHAKEEITKAHNCHWLEITESTREHGTNEAYLVEDKLHYSGMEYKVWAEQLVQMVQSEIQ